MEMNMLRKALWVVLKPLMTTISHLLNPDNGEEWLTELNKFNRKEPCWVWVNKFLRQLFASEEILLDPTTGTETLVEAKEVFLAGIDGDFKNYGTNRPSQPTLITSVRVAEQVEDARFSQMFGSTVAELDRQCLTQGQIINFCRKHSDKLRADGSATFFLFKIEDLKAKNELGKYFVAYVDVYGGGRLRAGVGRLSRGNVWYAESRRRVVTPQQKL